MRLVKLTGMPHPDAGGKSWAVYVDAERVLYIERGYSAWLQERTQESFRQSLQQLYEEVERVAVQLQKVSVNFEDPQVAKLSVELRDSSSALQAAAGLCGRWSAAAPFHPRAECTTIGLAYEGSGNTLARVHVTESPERCAELIYPPNRHYVSLA